MYTIIQTLTAHAFLMAVSLRCSFWTELAWWYTTGHFRDAPSLGFKARLGEKLLMWKWSIIYILTQIKLLFTRKVLHLPSIWEWEFLELGNGLFSWPCTSAWTIFWVFPLAHPQRWTLLKKSVLSVYYLSVYCKHGGLWYIFFISSVYFKSSIKYFLVW